MSEPIPILQVVVSTKAGGGPQHVLTVALGLRPRGWRSIVAGPADGPLFARFLEAGIETVALPTDRLGPLTPVRLARLIRRRGVRLVHSHGKGAGVHARLAARLAGVPAVHTFHGIHYERYPAIGRAAYLSLERRLSACTRVVVNVSAAQEREGRALGLFAPGQSRLVVNGVDVAELVAVALARDVARGSLGLDPAATVVGNAARFDEVKRLHLLVEAVAAVPALTLSLIGDGVEAARLRERAAVLGTAGRVRFAGEIPAAARLFPAFDVFAAPSRKEGLPLAVVEAMALGLPVVASDIPAHREVLGEGSAGLVAGTAAAFAERLAALAADPALRALLGRENRARAQREFGVARMLDGLEGVYREVLGL